MELSSVFSRIIFLALPGIVCNLMYGILKDRKARKDWEDFLQILVFSTISYLLYGLFVSLIGFLTSHVWQYDFAYMNAFLNDKIPVDWSAIFWASIIGGLFSILATYFYTYNLINRLGNRIRITRKLSDEDVWTDFFKDAHNKWVYVRDHKLNLTYYGWVKLHSDSNKDREIVLGKVSIHLGASGELGEAIFERDSLYISREKHDLTIELRGPESNDGVVEEINSNES